MIKFRTLADDQPDLTFSPTHVHHVFKTVLWRSALKLDSGSMLQ